MTAKQILFRILVSATIVLMWAWMSADDWEHEMILERSEQERITAIRDYHKSIRADRTSEDYVDTTPVPIAEAEPTYISAPVQTAKKSVVKAKKRIKKSVKKNQAR